MHPAVRVLVLLSVASSLPAMSLPALAILGLGALLVYLRQGQAALVQLRGGLLRLRWLVLAIVVLYAGFTPGEPLVASLPGLSREGLSEGLRRTLVLVDLLVMVYLLLAVTPIAALVGAIELLLAPLHPLRIDPQRVALRIGLALEAVGEMHGRLRGAVSASGGWERAARLIVDIERRAALDEVPIAPPPSLPRPRWWEWLLPVALLLALHTWTP